MTKRKDPFLQALNKRAKKGELEKRDFNREFMTEPPKAKVYEVGQTVKMEGNHPFSGHTGEVVAIQKVMGMMRPRIRLHDCADHEVFAMKDDEVRILR